MGVAIGQLLPIAVAIAVSPLAIVAVVLMLLTPRGRANGAAFVLAWALALALVGIVVILVAGGGAGTDDGGPTDGISWLRLALGVILLGLAVRRWRGRPRDGAPSELPRWMRALDRFSWPKAAAAGAALSAANPKNLILAIAGATVIAQAEIPVGQEIGALAVLVVIGTVGVAAPLAISLALGGRSAAVLDGLRDWMARNDAAIMAVLLLVIGAKLVGDALSGLWS